MTNIRRTQALSTFSCLGDTCPDTCCRGWSMQVDDATRARYAKEPELLNTIEQDQGGGWIMKKDAASSYCVKLEGGWCGIQKEYGDAFLTDACYFYPRVTRRLGDMVLMTASASCPEIARLMLTKDNALALEDAVIERVPETIKDYLPPELSSRQALAVHQLFLQAMEDKETSVEGLVLRIINASRALEMLGKKDWPEATPFYLGIADNMLPPADANPADPFNVLHALAGLIVASHKPMSEPLCATVSEMEQALSVRLDWEKVAIHADEKSVASYQRVLQAWQETHAPRFDALLRKWVQMQLSLSLHPFAGLGKTITERTTIFGVRFATFRLALMCACDVHKDIPDAEGLACRITQSLARLLDHLGDATFSLQIYNETGWVRESRLRGLLDH